MHQRIVTSGRRWTVRAVVVAAAVLPAPPHLQAAAGPAISGPAPASAGRAYGTEPGTPTASAQQVTLITGDRVRVTRSGGRYSVEPLPVPRLDGIRPVFLTQAGPDGIYVLPSDAASAVATGHLDRQLFNVEYLVENGYAGADAPALPVIVQHSTAARGMTRPPVGRVTRALESIHASAVEVTMADADDFWAGVRPGAAPGPRAGTAALTGGITKIWLDRKAKPALAESVPLVGAPAAWAAGYDGADVAVAVLDTGVDAAHPDLAGRIVESRSFVPGEDSRDGNGHGTHVTSTVGGTGAASAGARRGVAPGVRLLVGKVLDNSGEGLQSWLIDGMEWAAASGAKVVNVSVGTPTDGPDPASQAVDELTASAGTLFVVAAGNLGPNARTIHSPAIADAALSVAATDKADLLAWFSSRGPRPGDRGLKPDIAAPGEAIMAARATGTGDGDGPYTSMRGTSMAAPHVAGAAAILAQRYPDWAAPRLKAALMSTARDLSLSPYEQGAGRLDVARATAQPVHATTANLDFGLLIKGQAPANRQLSYANSSDRPVTLRLTPSLRSVAGAAVDGALRTEAAVTVPPGGTASVTVTVDGQRLGDDHYIGMVFGEADGVRLATPVALIHQPPMATLTVRTLGRDGDLVAPFASDVISVDSSRGRAADAEPVAAGIVRYRLPEGRYNVVQGLSWVDGYSRANVAYLINPEVTVTGDTTVVLDARAATRLSFTTPRPAEPLNNVFESFIQRTTTRGETYRTSFHVAQPVGAWARLWATPTQRVDAGRFRFATIWTLGQAELAMSVRAPRPRPLHPAAAPHWETTPGEPDWELHRQWVPFPRTQDLAVVDVGRGRPEDLGGLSVRGKLALVETAEDRVCRIRIETIERLREAGAAGLAVFPAAGSACPIPLTITQEPLTGAPKPLGVPYTFLPTVEGLALRAQAARAPVTVQVRPTPETPYTYVLSPYEEGRVPPSLRYTYTDRQLARVDMDVQAARPLRFSQGQRIWKQDDLLLTNTSPTVSGASISGPRTVREYIGPLSPTILHDRWVHSYDLDVVRQRLDVYDRPVRTHGQWLTGPRTPGAMTVPEKAYAAASAPGGQGSWLACVVCRQGDLLWPFFYLVAGGPGNRQHDGLGSASGDPAGFWAMRLRLYRDGQEVPEAFPEAGIPAFRMPPQPANYRLTATGPGSTTEWTFQSSAADRPVDRPGHLCAGAVFQVSTLPCSPERLVFVSYDMSDSMAIDGTVPAGQRHTFTVHPYHSPANTPMPRIAGLRLWVSTDDGARWISVPVRPGRDGAYTATATYPALHATTGAVSLKVQAWDTAGNRITQTTMEAVSLRDR